MNTLLQVLLPVVTLLLASTAYAIARNPNHLPIGIFYEPINGGITQPNNANFQNISPPTETSSSGNIVRDPNFHPLDPLTPDEVQKTSDIIEKVKRKADGWFYIVIKLKEPPKKALITSFLENTKPPILTRQAFATVVNKNSREACELIVNLDSGTIEGVKEIPNGLYAKPLVTLEEYIAAENALKVDPTFQEMGRKHGYTNFENLLLAPWDVGFDDDKPEWKGKRMVQMIGYEKLFDRDNALAHPMPFSTVYDMINRTIIEFEQFPLHEDFSTDLTDFTRSTSKTDNYDQSIPDTVLRKDVKPIVITTPEGVNYEVKGHQIKWQKWQMQVGFNGREGLVIYHVGYYDNTKTEPNKFRPLFYRLSVSEVWIPYGDPRPPYPRKSAFDQGDYGIGNLLFPLYSPADCKGTVHFFDGVINKNNGMPEVTKNCICVYEEDAGILWKHKDEISGDNNVVRSQRLVLTYHARVGNYDYLFYWYFYQDASIEFKAVLTGILSNVPVHKDAQNFPYGVKVSENVVAQIHQHFFCVRIDADIDGIENGVSTVDVVAVDEPTGSKENPYGNGLTYKYTKLKTAGEGRTKSSPLESRVWAVQNEKIKNRISGKPVSYKLKSVDGPTLLMKPDSSARARGNFTSFNTWVTPYDEEQMFAAGKHLNDDGLPQWVDKDVSANVWNTDIVVWHVLGVTHLPRIEDWPVMPVETTGFWLKPVNFFEKNPALDVPRVPTPEDFGDKNGNQRRRFM